MFLVELLQELGHFVKPPISFHNHNNADLYLLFFIPTKMSGRKHLRHRPIEILFCSIILPKNTTYAILYQLNFTFLFIEKKKNKNLFYSL